MQCNVSEIAQDIYRISTFDPEYGIQFNQFLPASSTCRRECGLWGCRAFRREGQSVSIGGRGSVNQHR